MLHSGNFQSEQVAAGKVFKERYYRNHDTLMFCRPVLLSGNVQRPAEERFQQRYYRKLKSLRLYRPVLLSGNVESQDVAAVVMFQTTILS